MIPPFDDSGFLPPGVHPATLKEIEARFGRESELRRVQMESVRWMVDLAIRAGVQRIVLNGSFVTDIIAMKLQSVHELENTRRKLRELEEEYEAAMKRPIDNAHVRDATLNSLRRLINQLKEEIARYEAHQPLQREAARS